MNKKELSKTASKKRIKELENKLEMVCRTIEHYPSDFFNAKIRRMFLGGEISTDFIRGYIYASTKLREEIYRLACEDNHEDIRTYHSLFKLNIFSGLGESADKTIIKQ